MLSDDNPDSRSSLNGKVFFGWNISILKPVNHEDFADTIEAILGELRADKIWISMVLLIVPAMWHPLEQIGLLL